MASLRTLYTRARLAWWLSNWRDVWATYSVGRPVPPLRFRNGLVLQHGGCDDPMSLFWEIFSNGYYRVPLRRGDGAVLDVGANIGAASLYWAQRAPWVAIHAYEPNPGAVELLESNIRTNHLQDRIHVFREAVAAASGAVPLYAGLNNMQASTVRRDGDPLGVVPAVTLEQAIARVEDGRVALLKIDAEGAEVEMLETAAPQSFAGVRRVIVEYHDFLIPSSLARCQAALETLGYRCAVRPVKRGADGYGLIDAVRAS